MSISNCKINHKVLQINTIQEIRTQLALLTREIDDKTAKIYHGMANKKILKSLVLIQNELSEVETNLLHTLAYGVED